MSTVGRLGREIETRKERKKAEKRKKTPGRKWWGMVARVDSWHHG